MRGLYDYAAGGDDEISISAGQTIELTAVGESYAEGWSEGIDKSGKKVCVSLWARSYLKAWLTELVPSF